MFKVNEKKTKERPNFSKIYIVDFEQVNVSWDVFFDRCKQSVYKICKYDLGNLIRFIE